MTTGRLSFGARRHERVDLCEDADGGSANEDAECEDAADDEGDYEE